MKTATTIRLGSILVIVSAILLSSSRQAVMQSGKTQQKPTAPVASPQQQVIMPEIPCDGCGGGGDDPGGGGGGGGGGIGGGGGTGDGHIWCQGWDTQGDCAFNHLGVPGSVTFRRQRGNNGYDFQTFLSWHPADIDGFGRFPLQDGNVGLISTSPLPGQVPLHRWSTQKGFYYSIYFGQYGGDYVYGGIAGYVWPAGDSRGFPLYQFYSQQYGHFYTNFPQNEMSCQPHVPWAFQGVMARVNWPGPIDLAVRICGPLGQFPPSCDPFAVERCRQSGGRFDFNLCLCFPF